MADEDNRKSSEAEIQEALNKMVPIFTISRTPDMTGMYGVTIDRRLDNKGLAEAFLSAINAFEGEMRETVLTSMMVACAEVLREKPLDETSERMQRYVNYILSRPKPCASC